MVIYQTMCNLLFNSSPNKSVGVWFQKFVRTVFYFDVERLAKVVKHFEQKAESKNTLGVLPKQSLEKKIIRTTILVLFPFSVSGGIRSGRRPRNSEAYEFTRLAER